MNSNNDRGIAVVLALFLMTAMSVIASSLMFLSQTETYASMNYRMMSQARYAGEAGVNKASDFILDAGQYTIPEAGAADDYNVYDVSKSPVEFGGNPVVLSTDDAEANYPIAAVQTAFKNATAGTLAAGNTNIGFSAKAELLTMQQFTSYAGTDGVVQTWRITGIGNLGGSRQATVEVEALIETPKVTANPYAAFATADVCGAMVFQGNTTTDSYDSSVGPPADTTQQEGGDVGTNGNLNIGGSVDVFGNLYSPREGVGDCQDGAVTALSESGGATIHGPDPTSDEDDDNPVQLPKALEYPLPDFDAYLPSGGGVGQESWVRNTTVVIDNTFWTNASAVGGAAAACTSLGLTFGTNCSLDTATKKITVGNTAGTGNPIVMPNLSIANGSTMVFAGHTGTTGEGQIVVLNSITGAGNVEVSANMTAANDESVALMFYGKHKDGEVGTLTDPTDLATPVDLAAMGWKQNSPSSSYDASALQIVYGGYGSIAMQGGNTESAASIYAPNADFNLYGTQALYGSVLGRTVTVHGNANIHYDRNLQNEYWIVGQPMIGTFSWKRY
jgi:hypothetical protein